MDKEELLDRLRRAYEMEEKMVVSLIDLLQPELFSEDIDPKKSKQIQNIILSIKKDSSRHESIVGKMIKELKNE